MALPVEAYRRHEFPGPHARRQFDFFAALNHPHFGLCARVDVTRLRAFARASAMGFHLAAVHALSSAANAVPELRRRGRARHVVEHARVHPSFTAPSDVGGGFGFCEVAFDTDALAFAGAARAEVARVATAPSLDDAPERDDYLFLSALPWVDFTGIQHAMQLHPGDWVPRISWGKVVPSAAGGEEMAVSLQAHHALVDGRAVGAFYAEFASYVAGLPAGT